MTEVRRIDPETGFIREFKEVTARLSSLETAPAGNIVIRETLTAEDPLTGVKTIIGQLPDGTVGFQPFVGDIVPPPVASTPIASAQPGNITVSWDGAFVDGAEKPKDFQHVNVKAHKVMTGSTVLSLTVGVIRLATETVIITTDVLSYGETWQFSLESEDYNGNRAALSARTPLIDVLSNADDSQVGEALAALAADAQAAQDAAQAAQDAADAAQGDADTAIADALAANNLAGTKGKVLIQSAAPAVADQLAQNLWIDTTGGTNTPKRWNGSAWAVVTDKVASDAAIAAGLAQEKADQAFNSAATAADAAGTAQDTADGKGRLWYQDDQPAGTGHNIGDTWFDTNDNYKMRSWNGAIWQTVQDAWTAQQTADSKGITYTQNTVPPVSARLPQNLWNDTSLGLDKIVVKYWSTTAGAWTALANKEATEARVVADSKGETIYSSTAPTVAQRLPQNLWVDTTGGININKRWDGSAWVVVADTRIASTATAVTAADAKAQGALDSAAAKSVVYTQSLVPPVEARLPQTLWNDTTLGLDKIVVKYWNGSAWTVLADKAATDAAVVATSKGETIYSSTEPTVAQRLTQNLWIDTTGGININKRWNGSGWVVVADTRIASSATAVTAADAKAQSALDTAIAKSVVYTQNTVPPVEARLPQTVWNDTSLGLANVVVKYWNGTAWTALADKSATDAQLAADAKGEVIYSATAPAASKQLAQNLWIDTTGGININKRWDGSGWVVVADTRIASSATAVTAADAKAQTALDSATAKGITYTQSVTPPVSARLPQNLWNDTSLGLTNVIVKYWDGSAWTALADKTATDAATLAATKTKTYYQSAAPSLVGNTTGDMWVDSDDNKAYIWNGAWTEAQDAAIAKGLFGSFSTDIDQTAPNKWLFTRYDRTGLVGTNIPSYLDIVGVAGTSSLVADGASLVNTVGEQYIGQLRTVVNVVSTKTVAITATHDDSGRVYVDGVSVYAKSGYTTNAPISFQLTAGWHVLDFMWTEQSGGDGWTGISPTVGSQVTSMYAPVSLSATSAAVSAAQTSANTAMAAQSYSNNASFDDWTSTYPTGFAFWNSTPVKETAIIRRAPFAMRFNVADAVAQSGVQFASPLAHAPNLEYFTVEVEFYLVSGGLGQAGVILDWNGLSPNRALINFFDEVPSPATGKWYRLVKTLRRPTGATGTFSSMSGYLMAQWSGHTGGGAAKNVIYDWFNIRPATTEEITSYGTPASIQTVTNLANSKGEVIYSDTAPVTAKQLAQNLWVDTTGGLNLQKRWSGSAWVVVADSRIAQSVSDISALTSQVSAVSAQADRSITTFYGSTTPVSPESGDLWLTGVAGEPMKRWSGAAWDTFEDPNVQAAYEKAGDAQSAADAKVRTWAQDTEPSPMVPDDVGDLWIDTNDNNKLWRYNGAIWVALQDGSIAVAKGAADAAQLSANGKNKIHYSTSVASGTVDTTDGNRPYVEGDTWFQRSTVSPFNIIGQWEFFGGAWVTRKISGLVVTEVDAATITVGQISAVQLSATAINGKTITGATVQTEATASRGIKLTTTELAGYDGAGVKNFSLTSAGALTLKGAIKSGSTIEGATLSAAGGGIETTATANRGVKLKDTGITTYDAAGNMTFKVDGATGLVEAPGLKANTITGTMISGTAIDGKIITGATIQTELTAARGIKLTSTELAGYDAVGTKNFSLTSAGVLALKGAISAGSTITGATLIGSGIETTATALRGVKLASSGIKTYDNAGNMTFSVDAATGEVEAPGIKANSIHGDKITSGTVSAQQIRVGDFTNLVTNGFGDLGTGIGFGSGLIYDTVDKPTEVTGVFKTTAGQGNYSPAVSFIDVDPNTEYTTEIWLKADKPNSRIYIELRDQAGGHATTNVIMDTGASQGIYALQNFVVPTVWTKYSIKSTTTAAATRLRFGIIYFNHVNGSERTATVSLAMAIRRRLGGSLIVDGAIDGKVITGATIQTEAAASRGIKLTSAELAGYDGTGVKNFSLDSAGALTLKGAIQSGSTITGATLIGSGIETTATALRGVKLSSSGITTYDTSGNMTFKVDAATGLVEAPGLKANSITGDMIAGQTITAKNLFVADFANLATIDELNGTTVTSYGQTQIVSGYNKLVVDSGTFFMFTDRRGPVPFVQGDTLYYEFTAKATAATTAQFCVYTYDAADSNTSVTSPNHSIGTTDTPIKGEIVVNSVKANAVQFVLGLSGVANKGIQVKGVKVYKKFGGQLIVDGAIDGKLITGATVQTDTGATTGIKLTPTELAGWDGTNKNFSLTSAGALTLKGAIQSGSTIEGAKITGTSGLETSTVANTGVKITNTGIKAYDAGNNLSFSVDAATGLVEAPGLKANSITGTMVAAGTLTADKLLVSRGANLFTDPLILDSPGWADSAYFSATGGKNGGGTINLPMNASQTGIYYAQAANLSPRRTRLVPGGTYRLGGWVKTSAAAPIGTLQLYLRYQIEGSTTGALASNVATEVPNNQVATVANTWTFVTGMVTIPESATYSSGVLGVYKQVGYTTGTTIWSDLSIQQAMAGELIVDGAVTTNHMTANTIDGAVITAGTLKATKLEAKSIGVDKLIISSSDNMIVEASFENVATPGINWTRGANQIMQVGGGRNGGNAIRLTGTVGINYTYNLNNKITVDDDNRFKVSMWVKSNVALTSDKLRVGVKPYKGSTTLTNVSIFSNSANSASANYLPGGDVWTQITGVTNPLPAGTTQVEWYINVSAPSTTAYFDIDALSVTRASDGTLIVDGAITAKKMEADLILATKIIAGDPTGTYAEMSPQGFRVFADGVDLNPSTEVARLGVAGTNDYFAITKANGDVVGSINQDGLGSFAALSVGGNFEYKGENFDLTLDRRPRGIATYGYMANATIGPTEIGIGQVHFTATRGRAYRVHVRATTSSWRYGGSTIMQLRTAVGSTPNINSYRLHRNETLNDKNTGYWHDKNFSMIWYPSGIDPLANTWVEQVLLTGINNTGGGANSENITLYDIEISIEDIGLQAASTMTVNNGGGTLYQAAPPPSAPAVYNHVRQFGANNSASYTGSNAFYNFDTGRMYQGLSPAGYGNLKSIATFNDMTGMISSATINYMRVYFNFAHWYYNSGGTARIGLHRHLTTPGTFSQEGIIVNSGGWPKPGARWVDIPSNYWNDFKNGWYRGVSLEGDSTYGTYGYADRPTIEIGFSSTNPNP